MLTCLLEVTRNPGAAICSHRADVFTKSKWRVQTSMSGHRTHKKFCFLRNSIRRLALTVTQQEKAKMKVKICFPGSSVLSPLRCIVGIVVFRRHVRVDYNSLATFRRCLVVVCVAIYFVFEEMSPPCVQTKTRNNYCEWLKKNPKTFGFSRNNRCQWICRTIFNSYNIIFIFPF